MTNSVGLYALLAILPVPAVAILVLLQTYGVIFAIRLLLEKDFYVSAYWAFFPGDLLLTIYLMCGTIIIHEGIYIPSWLQWIIQIAIFIGLTTFAVWKQKSTLASVDEKNEVIRSFANLPSQKYHISVVAILGSIVLSILPIVIGSSNILAKTVGLLCVSIYCMLFILDGIRNPNPFSY